MINLPLRNESGNTAWRECRHGLLASHPPNFSRQAVQKWIYKLIELICNTTGSIFTPTLLFHVR